MDTAQSNLPPVPNTNLAAPAVEEAPSVPAQPTPPVPPPVPQSKPRRTCTTPRAAWARDTRAGLRIAARRLHEIVERLADNAEPEADGSELTHLIQSLVRLNEAAIKEEEHRAEQATAAEKARQSNKGRSLEPGFTTEVVRDLQDELKMM